MTIHDEHPFQLPPEERDLGRRFRGRLAAGVTVMTAGSVSDPVGLTVSSVTLVDGDPWQVVAVVSDSSDFFDRVEQTGELVIQVLEATHRSLADRLAGLAPAPGGMFRDVPLLDTPWGPRIEAMDSWLGAANGTLTPLGRQFLLVAEVAHVEVHDLVDPLLYYRGKYRSLRQM